MNPNNIGIPTNPNNNPSPIPDILEDLFFEILWPIINTTCISPTIISLAIIMSVTVFL